MNNKINNSVDPTLQFLSEKTISQAVEKKIQVSKIIRKNKFQFKIEIKWTKTTGN